jgi:hypothetical protein
MTTQRGTSRSATRHRSPVLLLLAVVATLVLAVTTFGANDAAAAPALILTPTSGPCGSQVVIHGEGAPPGRSIDLFARRIAPTPVLGAQFAETRAGADGTFTIERALLGCAADPEGAQIDILAMLRPTDPRADSALLASAVFTISTAPRCFAETGHCARGRFLTYWATWGALPINGYPISDEFVQVLEDGRPYTVQYFERVRLEYHPENAYPYDVLLGQFGRRFHAADAPVVQRPGGLYFAESGHNLRGRFATYWEREGGLMQFGYPLSEEFTERLEDGKTYTVQYFERARLEYHPENPVPYDVLLGQFGRRILAETTGR